MLRCATGRGRRAERGTERERERERETEGENKTHTPEGHVTGIYEYSSIIVGRTNMHNREQWWTVNRIDACIYRMAP